MIFDMRTYDLVPGGIEAYKAAVKELALPIRERYGIRLAGWYYTEIGTLNRVVHIWAFRDWAHLNEAKAQFRKDPDWAGKYLPRVQSLIVAQHSQVVHAADFSPQPTLP
jgi:NIPSNAP